MLDKKRAPGLLAAGGAADVSEFSTGTDLRHHNRASHLQRAPYTVIEICCLAGGCTVHRSSHQIVTRCSSPLTG